MIDPEEEQRIERVAERLIESGLALPPRPLIDWTAPMPEGNAVYDPVLEAIEILRQADQI